jgi:hypothetical protein
VGRGITPLLSESSPRNACASSGLDRGGSVRRGRGPRNQFNRPGGFGEKAGDLDLPTSHLSPDGTHAAKILGIVQTQRLVPTYRDLDLALHFLSAPRPWSLAQRAGRVIAVRLCPTGGIPSLG